MSTANARTSVEDCNCFAIKKAARQAARLYDSFLQPAGIRISQFLILAWLEEVGSASINRLAEHLDTERTAMGKMVAVLERDGLVHSGPAPTDGRLRLVALTPEGRRTVNHAVPLWMESQCRMDDLNGAQRMADLKKELARLDMRGTAI